MENDIVHACCYTIDVSQGVRQQILFLVRVVHQNNNVI